VHVLADPDLTDPLSVIPASAVTVTIDDLVTAHGGARTYLASQGPVEFSVAFIVVGDEPFTSASTLTSRFFRTS